MGCVLADVVRPRHIAGVFLGRRILGRAPAGTKPPTTEGEKLQPKRAPANSSPLLRDCPRCTTPAHKAAWYRFAQDGGRL